MAEKTNANIGFEKELWDAADSLRGHISASDYRKVIIGLIFLKYVSDAFERKYQELLEEGEGFEEDRDEYAAEHIFYVPENARWKVIASNAHSPEIGIVLDDAMCSIEKENKSLKSVLPQIYASQDLDKRVLGNVVDIFTNINMREDAKEKDLLGRTYEYCIAQFAAHEGKNGGEFYTPTSIVKTIVEILKPYQGRVYDPACGSGGMFVQSAKFVESHSGNIANPPFNISKWGADQLQDDVRWKYGVPPNGNANYAWIQHMIYHLAPNGKIGMVLANGSLSSQSGGEGEIRRKIVEDDLVEGIIAMPTQLFYTTQIPVSLWFISRNKKQKGKTLFIDARKMGTMVNRRLREMTAEDVAKIAATFEAFNDGTLEDVKGFCAAVSTSEIAKQDFILTPGRYVGIEEQEDDGEPFEEKMARLTGELSVMFKRSHELEEEIRERLGAIGFEV